MLINKLRKLLNADLSFLLPLGVALWKKTFTDNEIVALLRQSHDQLQNMENIVWLMELYQNHHFHPAIKIELLQCLLS